MKANRNIFVPCSDLILLFPSFVSIKLIASIMRFLCTLTTLFSFIAASVASSTAPMNPQLLSKLTMVSVTSTRGGGNKAPSAPTDSLFRAAGNMFSSKEVQMLSDILHPSNLAKAASEFLQEQSTAARQRRDFYQSNADDAPYLSIFQPIRLLKLTVAAFLLSEVIDLLLEIQNVSLFTATHCGPWCQGVSVR